MNLASRSLRDLDDGNGPQAITDARELAAVRRQARIVYAKSFALAAAGCVLMLLRP